MSVHPFSSLTPKIMERESDGGCSHVEKLTDRRIEAEVGKESKRETVWGGMERGGSGK